MCDQCWTKYIWETPPLIIQRMNDIQIRAVEERDQDEVLHVWKRYHLDELPYTFTRVFLTEKPIRIASPILVILWAIGFVDITSLVIMLASLYTIVYMVSLVEISSYVNSRPDMKSIKAHWKDRFHVAVDSNQKIVGTIAFAEKKHIHWKDVPIEGETVEINSVLGKFSIKNHFETRAANQLKTLEVIKEYRRRGIARKLMKSVLEKVPDANIYLETSFAQSDAVKFYESFGFISNEIRRNYSVEWPAFLKQLLDFSFIQCYKRLSVQ